MCVVLSQNRDDLTPLARYQLVCPQGAWGVVGPVGGVQNHRPFPRHSPTDGVSLAIVLAPALILGSVLIWRLRRSPMRSLDEINDKIRRQRAVVDTIEAFKA
jgi:hypothetical protein